MIGHDALIRMRMARKRPKAVWLWVGTTELPWAASWHLYNDLWAHPEIVIEPKDNLKSLDLRFLTGLQVHVDGNDTTERMYAAHVACMKAGAKQVFTLHNGELIYDQGDEIAVS